MRNIERSQDSASDVMSTIKPDSFVLTEIDSNRYREAGDARRKLEEAESHLPDPKNWLNG